MAATVKNFQEFEFDLKKFAKQVDESISSVHRKISFQIFSDVVMSTPVKTGHAQSNWNFGVGAPDEDVQEGNAGDPFAKLPTEDFGREVVYIINNVKYIRFLENGTEHIDAHNMVKGALQHAQQTLQSVLK